MLGPQQEIGKWQNPYSGQTSAVGDTVQGASAQPKGTAAPFMDASAYLSAGITYAATFNQQVYTGLFGKDGRQQNEPTSVGIGRPPTPATERSPMMSTSVDTSWGAKSPFRIHTNLCQNQDVRADGGIYDKGSGHTIYQFAPLHT